MGKRVQSIDVKGLFGAVTISDDAQLIIVGRVFQSGQELTANGAYAFFEKVLLSGKFDQLSELDGFFSVIYEGSSEIFLISDRMRSRPIFYSCSNGITVSDDFGSVVRDSHNVEMNLTSKEEICLTGYVTGKDTLVENVYQVEAAQVVKIDRSSLDVQAERYWVFLPESKVDISKSAEDEEYFLNQLDQSLTESIDKLIRVADGRQIVVPLSGGYDSRAIAIYLKMSGYSNVYTFTFGTKGSHEVEMSERVAKALGFDWGYIEYSRRTWREFKRSDDYFRYMHFIGSGVSVANVQVLPAIRELLLKAVVNKDAIIVPGHTADFVAGGHFTRTDLELKNKPEVLFKAITSRHYKLSKQPVGKSLERKITDGLRVAIDASGGTPAVAVAESWNWSERQSKFIANSNRYYDFYQMEWWMPFWDKGFSNFWMTVPYRYRVDKKLWIDFVDNKMTQACGKLAPTGSSKTSKSRTVRVVKGQLSYFFDANSSLTLVPFCRWLKYRLHLSKKSGALFGYLSEEYVESLEKSLRNEKGTVDQRPKL